MKFNFLVSYLWWYSYYPCTGRILACVIHVNSDIYDHCKQCKTHVKAENFTIIDTLQTENGLLLLESLHQKTKKPVIGKQQQSTPLMSFD